MKRLIVCCDGTWQGLDSPDPTNVIKLAQIIKPTAQDGTSQLIYYQSGLGTGSSRLDKYTGGIFGWGIDTAIQNAYQFLSLNYEKGDEIYLFGFSRGAYTVRSLAGFIYCSGLLHRQHIRKVPEAYELYRLPDIKPSHPRAVTFRRQHGENVEIKLLGCWDTVGKLGIPLQIPIISRLVNAKYQFHDIKLNRNIQYALHAVAIDERRAAFDVTPMEKSENAPTQITQVWFPGTHGCVGGGEKAVLGLSNAAFLWMRDEIKTQGLGLDLLDKPEVMFDDGLNEDPKLFFDPKIEDIFAFGGTLYRSLYSDDTDPENLRIDQAFFERNVHRCVKERWALTEPSYRPKNLMPYRQWFDAFLDGET